MHIGLARYLYWIGRQSAGAADAIGDMPFLDTVDPADVLAVESLYRLAYFGPDDSMEPLLKVLAYPSVADGIVDDETAIIATIHSTLRRNRDPEGAAAIVDDLLDPETVLLERRGVDLPLAGTVPLVIVRTVPGPPVTMDLLEDAVRHVEGFMSLPFPTGQVNYLFADALAGGGAGANSRTHITSRPFVDGTSYVKNERETSYAGESTHRHFVHEVSHYYWRGNPVWLDEGAAAFIEAIARSKASGLPLSVEYRPCAHASNIAGLERLRAEGADFSARCDAGIGERLYHSLYRSLGDAGFREAFSRLYLLSQTDDPDDGCAETKLGICHVRAAFVAGVSEGKAAEVRKIVGRWYDGSEPHDLSWLDTAPPDPDLPSAGARIEEAYLVAYPSRDIVTSVSTSEDDLWVRLRLRLSGVASPGSTLDVVGVYEDGFEYPLGTWELGPDGFAERVWVLPPGAGAVGSHLVMVYDGDRKVAQVEYEVTP